MDIQIHGIGRSGTSLVQSLIYNHLKLQPNKVQAIYEPLLWNFHIHDEDIQSYVNKRTHLTKNLCIEGIHFHEQMPLFPKSAKKWRKHIFIKSLQTSCNSFDHNVIKCIRTAGRLNVFAKSFPKSKIIYLTRNPLDTIYSSFNRFSIFGGEVYPSDIHRFISEKEDLRGLQFEKSSISNDFIREVEAWYCYTAYALDSLKKMKNAMVIPYENLISSPQKHLNKVSDFLGFDEPISSEQMEKKVGPITKYHEINSELFKDMQEIAIMYENLLTDSKIELEQNISSIFNKYTISESFSSNYRKNYGKNTFYFLEHE